MRSQEAHTKKSRWMALPRDPLLELKWGLALLGEEGRTEYLAWLNKQMSHQASFTSPAWLEKLLPSSDPPGAADPRHDEGGRSLPALIARRPHLPWLGPSPFGVRRIPPLF